MRPLEVRANTCSSMRVDSFVRSLNLGTAIPRELICARVEPGYEFSRGENQKLRKTPRSARD